MYDDENGILKNVSERKSHLSDEVFMA